MRIKPLVLTAIIYIFCLSCSEDSEGLDRSLTQDELGAITGLYNLIEYTVNPPQDLNQDNTYSADLMEELECLSASIILREDLTYSKYYEELNITFITNDQYSITCGGYITENGTWDLDGDAIVFSEEPDWKYSLNGDVLTLNLGKDLPDFLTQVYLKQ